jgi:imidazolonepropionase-like amidohydrolase
VLLLHPACSEAQRAPDRAEARRTLALYELELAVIEQLLEASEAFPSGNFVIRHVGVVNMVRGVVLPDMRVRFGGGWLLQVDPESDSRIPAGYSVIDGRGKYLLPGLTDMHVHQLTSASQHLLHIAAGVTTVRDMGGFPWLLRWRDLSARDEWLAPTMIVAGPILSAVPMGMYAQVVTDDMEARRAVRGHHAAGYDFIKVHNVLPRPLLLAVTDEAKRLGLDVAGHVPHRMSVAEAIDAGLTTLEHLKGYVDDRTLQIARDDWVTPTRESGVWNTPTLYSKRLFLTPEKARAWSRSAEARLVPAMERDRWLADVTQPPEAAVGLVEKQREVMRRLVPVTNRFLAGTDAGGGYPFMVSGLALHEELRLLNQSGLSILETLRSATLYPARALQQESNFGEVAVGRRADLLLLDANPLVSLDALNQRAGVAVRGRWLDRVALEGQLNKLARTYAMMPRIAEDEALPDPAWVRRFADRVRLVQRGGYVFPDHHMREMVDALDRLGLARDAELAVP